MSFRLKYKKATGLKLAPETHIHHIDGNKSNNNLENLVHVSRSIHIRYHHLINMVKDVLKTLEINQYTIADLENDKWLRGFCIPFSAMDKWWNKLYLCEKHLLNQVKKRNRLAGTKKTSVFILDKERKVIEIYKNKSK